MPTTAAVNQWSEGESTATATAARQLLTERLLAEGGAENPLPQQRRALLKWMTSDLTGCSSADAPSVVEQAGVSRAVLRTMLHWVTTAEVTAALKSGARQATPLRAAATGEGGSNEGSHTWAQGRHPAAAGSTAGNTRAAAARGPAPLSDLEAFPALSPTKSAKPPKPEKAPRRRLVPTRLPPHPLPDSDAPLLSQALPSAFTDTLSSSASSWPPLVPSTPRPTGDTQPSEAENTRSVAPQRATPRPPPVHNASQHNQQRPLSTPPPSGTGERMACGGAGEEAAPNGDVGKRRDDALSDGGGGREEDCRGGGGGGGLVWGESLALFWLAEGHAALLVSGGVPNLAAELGTLLQLLSASRERPSEGASSQQQHAEPESSAVTPLDLAGSGLSQAYAIAVLRGAGRLIQAAPQRLLALLIDPHSRVGAKLAARAPELQAAVEQCVAEERQRRLHSEKAYNSVPAGDAPGRGASSLVGLHWTLGQERNQGSRSQQEQRRVTNLERCRDDFVKLMQEASRGSFASTPKSIQSGVDPAAEEMRNGCAAERKSGAASNDEMVTVLKRMRLKASELLLALQPGNLSGFAAIFMGGFLQAARTGEAIMDDQLASLEQKDPSRFQRLSQRFHAKPGAAGGGGGSNRRGGVRGSGGGGRGGGGRGGRGNGGRYGSAAGADEQAVISLAVAEEFPASLQLYVIFLEACDSARLNAAIAHSTASRLTELSQLGLPNGDGTIRGGDKSGHHVAAQQLGDRVAQLTSLALLLSYFSFASASSSSSGMGVDVAVTVGGGLQTIGPVQVDTVLRCASVSDGPGLAATLPWLLAYLRFLPRHPTALGAARRSSLLPCLAALYRRPELRPSDAAFGAGALCLRSLLDDWAAQSGAAVLGGSSLWEWEETSALGPDSNERHAEDVAFSWERLPQMLLEMAAAMDSRYAAHCCPALEEAVQLTMACLSGGTATEGLRDRSQVRRLTPSQPKAATRSTLAAPPAVLAAASPVHEPVKLRLQKAFLDEYSGLGQKVALRELVAYVSDVAAANAVTSATVPAQMGPRLAALERWLRDVMQVTAAQLAASYQAQDVAHEGAVIPEGVLRQRLLGSPALVEQLAPKVEEATYGALLSAFEEASATSRSAIGVALRALIPPLMEEPLVRTATAIATEYATSSCAQQLLELIPRQVQQHAAQACQRVAATVAGEFRQEKPPSAPSDTAVADDSACVTPAKAGASSPSTSTPVPDPETSNRATTGRSGVRALKSTTRTFGGWRVSAVALHPRPRDDDGKDTGACIFVLDEGSVEQATSTVVGGETRTEASTPIGSSARQSPSSNAHRNPTLTDASSDRDRSPAAAPTRSQFTPLSARVVESTRGPRSSMEDVAAFERGDDDLSRQYGNGPTPIRLAALLEEVAGGSAYQVVSGLGTPQMDERKARALHSRIDPLQLDGTSLSGPDGFGDS